MRLFVLLNLALLASAWSPAECIRVAPADTSHAEVNSTSRHTDELGKGFLARLGFEFPIKKLMQLSFDDYSDFEAPPGLAEANHGPIVFFRPKRRKRPPGFNPQGKMQAKP